MYVGPMARKERGLEERGGRRETGRYLGNSRPLVRVESVPPNEGTERTNERGLSPRLSFFEGLCNM